ncbi:hypothetical protein Agabi119p4_7885 [Agaricus bisporus var. burnettii]|uniref:Uncharacterized protein n=1 Tax=Agaricus bisporus var. burnettii TaxID=192524 RepID=A0A8H7C7Y0_AGABI|nr:hypothetical protein Agabi119p4_7885 [Agaricus bisporus var. burnettii]
MVEPQPQPLVCVFLKLPPSHRPVSRIYEIAWDVFLPQLNRLNEAFEAAQAVHPSSEAKKVWSEARKNASKKMSKLQDITFASFNTAFDFLEFLNALYNAKDTSEPYRSFRNSVNQAISRIGIAQEVMLEFREDIRIVIGQFTAIMSNDDRDISPLTTESSQSLLELATGVEECNAVLEEYCEELKEVQQQGSEDKANPPSEEELRVVREKWLAFKEISGPNAYRWQALKLEMQGLKDRDKKATRFNNPANSTTPVGSSNNHRMPFWRKFFRRILSCLSVEKFVR